MFLEPTPHSHPYFTLIVLPMQPNVKMDGWGRWLGSCGPVLGPWRSIFFEGAGSTLIRLCSLPTQQAQYLKRHHVQPLAPLSSGAFWPCQETLSKHYITQLLCDVCNDWVDPQSFVKKPHVSEVFCALPALQWALLAHVYNLTWLYSTLQTPDQLSQEFSQKS